MFTMNPSTWYMSKSASLYPLKKQESHPAYHPVLSHCLSTLFPFNFIIYSAYNEFKLTVFLSLFLSFACVAY